MQKCIVCHESNRINQNHLLSSLLSVTYESDKIITSMSLPRKYTIIHNKMTKHTYINVGHNYDTQLIDTHKNQLKIIAKWIKKVNRYRLYFTVLISNKNNIDAKIRNEIFCTQLGSILEGIAFAEKALIKSHPGLAESKIFIYFKSIDQKFNRVEYWNRLDYWVNHSMIKVDESSSDVSYEDSNIKFSDNEITYHQPQGLQRPQRPMIHNKQGFQQPQVCHACQAKPTQAKK